MADLADELLRDLEGSDDDQGEYDEETVDAGSPAGPDGEETMSSVTKLQKRKGRQENGEDGMHGDESGSDEEESLMKHEDVEMAIPEGGVKPAEELDAEDVAQMQLRNVRDVRSVAKLTSSKAFKEVLQKVSEYAVQSATDISSAESAEYKLIVQANNMAVEIDNEVLVVQKVRQCKG